MVRPRNWFAQIEEFLRPSLRRKRDERWARKNPPPNSGAPPFEPRHAGARPNGPQQTPQPPPQPPQGPPPPPRDYRAESDNAARNANANEREQAIRLLKRRLEMLKRKYLQEPSDYLAEQIRNLTENLGLRMRGGGIAKRRHSYLIKGSKEAKEHMARLRSMRN